MSKFATKWQPIPKDEYMTIFKNEDSKDAKLQVYSSYTNHDGNDGLTYSPQIETTWGNNEKELIKARSTREDKYAEWEHNFWKAIEWESEED